MRKCRIFICMGLILALLPTMLWARNVLPVRSKDYIEKKYAGWNGVLRVWLCCEWRCAQGFTGWLNACANAFEKENAGVYVEIEPVSAELLRGMDGSGLNLPDALLFSNGANVNPASLLPLESETPLRAPLTAAGCGRAIPVAMGGYILARTTQQPQRIALPLDGAFNHSAALIALSEEGGAVEIPEVGIDLGLPASAAARRFTLSRSEDPIEEFIGGGADAVLTDQSGLMRLNGLRNAGRCPDWTASESGRCAFTDQLLFCAVPRNARADGEAREECATRFIQSLLSDENQQRLSSAGAFSVLGERIYPDASPLAPLERLLISRTLIVPPCFGARKAELSDIADRPADGSVSPREAVARLCAVCSPQCEDDK